METAKRLKLETLDKATRMLMSMFVFILDDGSLTKYNVTEEDLMIAFIVEKMIREDKSLQEIEDAIAELYS